jgi:hypothetical protein
MMTLTVRVLSWLVLRGRSLDSPLRRRLSRLSIPGWQVAYLTTLPQ